MKEAVRQITRGRSVTTQGIASAKAQWSARILTGSSCCWVEKWISREEGDSGCPGRNLLFPVVTALPGTYLAISINTCKMKEDMAGAHSPP